MIELATLFMLEATIILVAQLTGYYLTTLQAFSNTHSVSQ